MTKEFAFFSELRLKNWLEICCKFTGKTSKIQVEKFEDFRVANLKNTSEKHFERIHFELLQMREKLPQFNTQE
jgi:hypothetical protein